MVFTKYMKMLKCTIWKYVICAVLVVGVAAGVGVYFVFALANTEKQIFEPPPSNSSAYTIQYITSPGVTSIHLPYIYRAITRWQKIINGSLATGVFVYDYETREKCGFSLGDVPSMYVDDILIYFEIENIDGVSGKLGQATWCMLDRTYMPRVAYVTLDAADVRYMISKGTFENVLVHEIAHCLGFGTTWELQTMLGTYLRQYITPRNQPSPWYFTRPEARIGHTEVTASSDAGDYPEIDSSDVSGTSRGHWSDARYNPELMTGYITSSYQPLSVLTLRSLMDIGYQVDLTQADGFRTRSSTPRLRQEFTLEHSDYTPPAVVFVTHEVIKI
jgi:hypothetical protein